MGGRPTEHEGAEAFYRRAAAEFGPVLSRLARSYEADADKRRDLLQEIHVGLWRSFAAFMPIQRHTNGAYCRVEK